MLTDSLENKKQLTGILQEKNTISGNVTNIIGNMPHIGHYKGKYNITPLAYQQQELETKDKVMKENLIVKEVPFFQVSNTEGTTVYIGSEI